MLSSRAKRVSIASVLTALAVAISPLHFAWGPTKAFPAQHMVNAVAGVVLGPAWAALVATLTGTIRIAMGTGTVFAYPGGIPGGVLVGAVYYALRRRLGRRALALSALAEPVGTVGIGGLLTWYCLDPLLGSGLAARFASLTWFALGWLLSSVTGSLLGLAVLLTLERAGLLGGLSSGA